MNRKNNKKGFTIVELVIVIAVIGILAAVLIPTFSGVINSANKSAAEQYARNKYTELYAADLSDGLIDSGDNAYSANATDDGAYAYVVTDAKGTTPASVLVTVYKNGVYATFDGSAFGTASSVPSAPNS